MDCCKKKKGGCRACCFLPFFRCSKIWSETMGSLSSVREAARIGLCRRPLSRAQAVSLVSGGVSLSKAGGAADRADSRTRRNHLCSVRLVAHCTQRHRHHRRHTELDRQVGLADLFLFFVELIFCKKDTTFTLRGLTFREETKSYATNFTNECAMCGPSCLSSTNFRFSF